MIRNADVTHRAPPRSPSAVPEDDSRISTPDANLKEEIKKVPRKHAIRFFSPTSSLIGIGITKPLYQGTSYSLSVDKTPGLGLLYCTSMPPPYLLQPTLKFLIATSVAADDNVSSLNCSSFTYTW